VGCATRTAAIEAFDTILIWKLREAYTSSPVHWRSLIGEGTIVAVVPISATS
jgi:hypothetical protein